MTVAQLNGFYAPEFLAEGRQRFAVGTLATGMDRSARAVEISDARALQAGEGLSEAAFFARHSFALLPHASAVSDWDNDIAAVYLPEIGRVVRERLFPGQRVEIQQQPNVLRRGRATLTPEYADGVHSDGGLDLDDYIHNIGAFANEQAAQWWRALYERKDVVGVVWIDFWRTTNNHRRTAVLQTGRVLENTEAVSQLLKPLELFRLGSGLAPHAGARQLVNQGLADPRRC